MSRKNKILALTIATASVMSSGFASMFSSYAAYSEDQINATLKQYGINTTTLQDIMSAMGMTYEQLLSCIKDDGTIDISKFTPDQKSTALILLQGVNFGYKKISDGVYELVDKNGKTISSDQLKQLLLDVKNYQQPVQGNQNSGSSSESGGFVSSESSSSTGGGATSGTANSSTSSQTKNDGLVKSTSLPVAQAYKLDKVEAETKVNVEKIVEKLATSTTPSSVTLDVGNAEWAIESTSVNKSEVKNFAFNPGVSVATINSTVSNIPDDVKTVATGKNTAVIDFQEKDGTKLPFNAKVKVKLGSQYANKKMDVWYILKGKSYKAGQVVVDGAGHVVCGFQYIGDFVFIEA